MADHDQRFKTLIQTFFREWIELFFPQWLDRFDWTGLTWLEQETFLDPPEGERNETDLLASLPLVEPTQLHARGSAYALILLHLEIESADAVATFPERMFDYYVGLRRKHNQPVLPMALYLQVGREGTGWEMYRETLWDEPLAEFRFPYVGLPALDGATYLNGESLFGVALSALMQIPEEARALHKAEAMRRLATSTLDTAQRFLLCECVDAYLPLEGPSLRAYDALLRTPKYGEPMRIGKTTFERGQEIGQERGIEIGQERGIEIGQERGQRALLLRMLRKRFGPLPEPAIQHIEAANADELDRLADAVLDAPSLEALGL